MLCYFGEVISGRSHYVLVLKQQYEPAEKIGISDSMRDRLKREASTGMDSEKKQSNVILYIGAAIAVLVALGGQGILY
jgi:hypothetical protein